MTDFQQNALFRGEIEKYYSEFVEGGISFCNTTVGSDFSPYPEVEQVNFDSVVITLDKLRNLVEKHSDKLVFVEYAEDVRRAKKEGKIAIMPKTQGCAGPIESNLALLRALHRLGLKVIQLAYNSQTTVGTGCCELHDTGLTLFGRRVVEEMNRIGVIVDVSHVSDSTRNDAIELSKDPVICSHESCRALCNTLRNMTDESIKALAAKGGVIGLCCFPAFLSLDQSKKRANVNDFLDHVDHVANLVGVDHIGISTDINWIGFDEGFASTTMQLWRRDRPDVYGYDKPLSVYPPPVVGLERESKFPNITRGLVARGYSDQDIMKIWGENWLRVMKQIWEK